MEYKDVRMDLDEYQALAIETLQFKLNEKDGKFITLMGLSGEVGELATEYKKQLRDGDGYTIFKEKLTEELGDILWYLSAIAKHEDLSLSRIAKFNLRKIDDRWKDNLIQPSFELFDNNYPPHEQLPRFFKATFQEKMGGDNKKYTCITVFPHLKI